MEAQLVGSPVKAIFIAGKELTTLPDDLFIPPDALEILLDSFSGPLDLLLYLIKKENIDILNIPIVSITRQYLHYIGLMGSAPQAHKVMMKGFVMKCCKAVGKMMVGPSKSAVRSRFQTTPSGCH